MVTRLRTRLEDDRLLPAFVLVSMVAGILIGNVLSISDFALTPPIGALFLVWSAMRLAPRLFGVRASDGMAVAGAAA